MSNRIHEKQKQTTTSNNQKRRPTTNNQEPKAKKLDTTIMGWMAVGGLFFSLFFYACFFKMNCLLHLCIECLLAEHGIVWHLMEVMYVLESTQKLLRVLVHAL